MAVHASLGKLASLALVVAVAAACGSAEPDDAADAGSDTRVFAADNGEVEIPTNPERVVATGYAVPVLIEAGAALAGISSWQRGLPMMNEQDRETYDELEKIAGEAAAETDYEAIAELDPDLIVVGVPQPVLTDVDMEYLESIAPVVALGPDAPEDWREVSRQQADAAGRLDAYDETRTAYEEKAATVAEKHREALDGVAFGHIGAYGDIDAGTFQREYAGSWGTNIAEDVGVTYYGSVEEKGGGSRDMSEYPSIEELPESLGEAEVVTYTVEPDGTPSEQVQYVLDSELWANLPAVRAGNAFPIRYTEAATYRSAELALESIDQALTSLEVD